jgi:hypothetical protein
MAGTVTRRLAARWLQSGACDTAVSLCSIAGGIWCGGMSMIECKGGVVAGVTAGLCGGFVGAYFGGAYGLALPLTLPAMVVLSELR